MVLLIINSIYFCMFNIFIHTFIYLYNPTFIYVLYYLFICT